MNLISRFAWLLVISFCCAQVYAAAPVAGAPADGVVAERGNIKLTLKDIDVVMEKVPYADRAVVVSGSDRLQQIIESELLNKQIAQRGREMKLMESPMIQKLVARATEQAFAKITLDKIVNDAKRPDFSLLAKEYYMANSAEFITPVASVVQHILISKVGRTPSQISIRVQEIMKKAQVPGAEFVNLVKEYSDDPSKDDNDGVMSVAKPGEFVPTFEAGAHALKKIGELSSVETEYGTHILRLMSRTASGTKSFESVREEIVTKLSAEFEEGIRTKLISDMRSANPIFHEDMIEAVRKRYGELPKIDAQSEAPAPAAAIDGTK